MSTLPPDLGLKSTRTRAPVAESAPVTGSAAVALLVMTTIRDSRWAVGYLLIFGVGTIAGMMLITEYRISFAPPGLSNTPTQRTFVLIESGAEFLGLFLMQLLLLTLLALRPRAKTVPATSEASSEISVLPLGNTWSAPQAVD